MIQSPGMWENWVYITVYTYESLCLINKKMREQLGHTNTAVFVHVTPLCSWRHFVFAGV